VVRLKDRATIPNKDFLLTYRVAGDTINDAVLTHRSERGGFFTLILQPPQRVTAEDVMPKELVFVLDTSGSMEGFPIEKAKQTMDLALNNLYPHDTFNLITFAGDTASSFQNPCSPLPRTCAKRRSFLPVAATAVLK
jgi:Ca-activated chloride channel family protein